MMSDLFEWWCFTKTRMKTFYDERFFAKFLLMFYRTTNENGMIFSYFECFNAFNFISDIYDKWFYFEYAVIVSCISTIYGKIEAKMMFQNYLPKKKMFVFFSNRMIIGQLSSLAKFQVNSPRSIRCLFRFVFSALFLFSFVYFA